MSIRKVLGLRGRDIVLDIEVNKSPSKFNQSLPKIEEESESDIASVPDLDSVSANSESDFNSFTDSHSEIFTMAFDSKEAREDIPQLTGKGNFQQFMAICQDFKDCLGETPENILVKIIKRKLIHREAFTLCRNATTFEEIKTILSNKFGEKAPLNVLISDMVNLRQKENEDAKSYGDRALILQEKLELVSEDLLKVSNLRNKDVTPVTYIYSKVMIEYFINGLKMSDVKNIVKANNFSELEKATEYADSLESSFKSNELLNRKNYAPNLGNSRFNQNNNRNQNSSRNSYQIPNHQNPKNQNSPRNSGGNTSGYSRNRNNNGYFENRNQNNAAGYSGNRNHQQHYIKTEIKTEPVNHLRTRPLICNFCGKNNHTENDCRQRQRNQINVLESKNFESLIQKGPDQHDLQMMKSLGIS